MKKRIADIVVDVLIENGIKNAFSVVGGGAMHLNNAFALKKAVLKTTYNHHEQASAMAAEAYARLTGHLAAVCVTSGPGGLNTLNGVQGAWVDSLPMIVIAGHPRYETTVESSGLNVRSIGVQENDIISQVKNITKYAKLVTDPLMVKREIQYAIDLAMDGRRGPVWISIPLDVQGAVVEELDLYDTRCYHSILPEVDRNQIEEILCELRRSKRPCILTGSGIRTSDGIDLYRRFLQMIDIPVVGGFGAPDNNYHGEMNYYGMSGSMGPRCGNFILQNADFILVIGNSLSSSQTGYNVEAFAPHARVYMIEAQVDESKKIGLHVNKCVWCDLKKFFEAYIETDVIIKASKEWRDYCKEISDGLSWFEVLDYINSENEDELVHPAHFWYKFLQEAEDNAIFSLGNSSSVHELLKCGTVSRKQRIIENYHNGSMGIDLPYAIGAAEGCPSQPIYCITGDGCIMMNLQELQTIKYNGYAVKIVIFNNEGYDNIRMTCKNYFGGLNNGCDIGSGLSMPDFEKIAEGFGFLYHKVSCERELNQGISWLISQKDTCIMEIKEKKDKERVPILKSVMDATGKFYTPAIHIMSPLLSQEKLKKFTKYC